jgi:ribonuclease HII
MRRAVEALGALPTEALIDGNRCPPTGDAGPGHHRRRCQRAGDFGGVDPGQDGARCGNAAHSPGFPQYGLDRHKGYDTAAHRAALNLHGPAPFHRRSFAPVRALLRRIGMSDSEAHRFARQSDVQGVAGLADGSASVRTRWSMESIW